MHVCVCLYVCECVVCMVPEVLGQQLGVIGYKIVAGDYIKQSHTYIFYYVHVRVHIYFVVGVVSAVAVAAAPLLVFVAVFETQSFNGTKYIITVS